MLFRGLYFGDASVIEQTCAIYSTDAGIYPLLFGQLLMLPVASSKDAAKAYLSILCAISKRSLLTPNALECSPQ
eukprot:2492028-Amphidinium_carterae.1